MESNHKTSTKTLSQKEIAKLESEILARESDKEFEFRYLQKYDYDNGFMETLS